MKIYTEYSRPEVVELISRGGIAVLRTDTLYGIVALASNAAAVSRVYQVKNRTPSKPPIVLISNYDQMFNKPSSSHLEFLNKVWPGSNSVIIPSPDAPDWIGRGTRTVAYRMPDHPALLALINQTGPLIAPSANPEGFEPAATIDDARLYFGDLVDLYIDSGVVTQNQPSSLFKLDDKANAERLR